jgi:cell division inhibitor SepF
MAGALRKTMVYLGLAEEDDHYAEYDEYDDSPDQTARRSGAQNRGDRSGGVTTLSDRRTVQLADVPGDLQRIVTLHPRTYNEARTIGEHYRDATPVIMNLTEMDDIDAKRLVDFAAGLVFALHGTIERVTSKVFLLSPANVVVTAEDKARIAESGFFNQS